jgi:flagellar basal-body rod protein FlgB
MSVGIFGGVDGLQRALDYHLRRQNVLASNLANVDTPNFRPMDLVRVEDEAAPRNVAMVATREGHFVGVGQTARDERLVGVQDGSIEAGADGNSVSLERELAKVSANELRYQGAVKLVARRLAALRYAANDGQNG